MLATVVAMTGGSATAITVTDSLREEFPLTDFSRHTVPLESIISGGPPKDGIPAIDKPRFVDVSEAGSWLDPREPVIVLELRGHARAYPLQILMYHEIVNDELAGVPVAVTFCPLCNASMVFDRRVDGRVLDFGTTGRLRRSDLVMYDRQTGTWWQQFTGKGIIGELAGRKLDRIASHITAFEDFAGTIPGGEVLSRETGHVRPYGRNPYQGYDEVGRAPFLFTDPLDPRLPAMERVVSVTHRGRARVYPFSELPAVGVLNDEVNGLPIVLFIDCGMRSALDTAKIAEGRAIRSVTVFDRRLGGAALEFGIRGGRIIDSDTGSEWSRLGRALGGARRGAALETVDSGVHFAFAWLAFRPESEIYRAAGDATADANACGDVN